MALVDEKTEKYIDTVTVDGSYIEGNAVETNLLEANTAYGVAYRYFASHYPDMSGMTVIKEAYTDKRGSEGQFIEKSGTRTVSTS